MPAARHWRLIGIETCSGNDLELSELHLYDRAGRADSVTAITCTTTPTAGALADLQDGNLTTACRFAGAAVRSSGFALRWDFGADGAVDAIGVRMGSTSRDAFLQRLAMQYSHDGLAWVTFAAYGSYEYPGAEAYTPAPVVADPDFSKVAVLARMDGASGSTAFVDESPSPKVVGSSSAQLSNLQSKTGGTSALITGYGYIAFGGNADAALAPMGQDFCIEGYCYDAGGGGRRVLFTNGRAGYADHTLHAQLTVQNRFSVSVVAGGVTYTIAPSSPTPLSVWYHLALTRSGSVCRLFLDGVEIGNVSGVTANVPAGAAPLSLSSAVGYLNIGGSSGTQWIGYVDNFRYTIGAARYTESFSPSDNFSEIGGHVLLGGAPNSPAPKHTSVVASSPIQAHSTRNAEKLALARDVEHGGQGTIYGTTKTKGTPNVPTKARVVLLHQRSKLPVRETWSDPVTGAFAFTGIDTTQQFITLAEDAAGNYRPVAANRLTPEVTP